MIIKDVGVGLVNLVRERRWSQLRSWGRSRLITTSFVWLIVVGWAARALRWLEHQSSGWPQQLHDAMESADLPDSMKTLYIMSVCFVVAQSMYWIGCPRIVRDYTDFGDFVGRHGHAKKPFDRVVSDLVNRLPEKRFLKLADEACKNLGYKPTAIVKGDRGLASSEGRKLILHSLVTNFQSARPPNRSELFDTLLRHADSATPFDRTLVVLLFILGFTGFIFVASNQFFAVMSFIY